MKFNLNDFLELDTTALLAVNGGSDCGTKQKRLFYAVPYG